MFNQFGQADRITIAVNRERCYLGPMLRNVTMLFLAVAVLFGSIHVTPWSHELVGTHEHSHDATHDDHGDANADLGLSNEQPAKKADVSGEIGHHHSIPTGIENAGDDFDTGSVNRQSLSAISQSTIPASHSRAPPTQPPSA